ncbi:MAG: B12-binding domain-containing radical SAM protein [Microbacter sp.]
MNVLLIVPGSSNIYAKLGSQLPSLGIAYIAAVCREHQHHVKIVDLGIDKNGLSPEVIEWAEIVGISADTPGYPKALLIAKKLKEAGKKIFMGGYHVTFLDREALETGYVDFVVRGEGEEIVVNMLEALENRKSLADVLGISYLENGVYKRNQDAPPPLNLDEMPFPARDLLPLKSYKGVLNGKPMTNLITSRGCPFNCYFCSSSRFGGLKWRARSAKSIADELEYLYRTYDYRAFAFMDDNFTLNPKRVFDFADEIERRGMTDISWWCFSRLDILVKNEAMVKRMAEVGAFMIFLGLESTNEEILDSYNKHIGNNQQQEAIALLRKYGIQIYGSYIIGDIQETEKMVN